MGIRQQTHLTKTAKEEAELIMKSILEICQIYHAPMFATVVTGNNEKQTDYNNIVYSAQSHQCRLYNDRIRKHLLVANGFECIPKPDGIFYRKSDGLDENTGNKRYTKYALDEEQIEEVKKRMARMAVFSEKYNTSVFAEVAVGNIDGKTSYEFYYHRPECQSYLKKDEIKKHILISEKDFDAVLPRDTTFVDMEEVFGEYVE